MQTGDDDGAEGSFERRLRAARDKHGMDRPVVVGGAKALPASALGVGLRVGVELVSALVVAVVIGLLLDRWLHTSPIFLVVFVLMGGAAGVANVYRLMGPGAEARLRSKNGRGDDPGGS